MPLCAVNLCGQSSWTQIAKEEGLSFHKFPNNARIRDVWITAAGRGASWLPDKHSAICSRHFSEDCFQNRKVTCQNRLLLDNAVPTLNLPTSASLPNLIPQTPIISSYLVQEEPSDPTSIMIQAIPVVPPKNMKTAFVPLQQTNQIVIKMEEGIGVIKEEPASPTSSSPPHNNMTIISHAAANPTCTIVANTTFTNEAKPTIPQASNPTVTGIPIDPNDPLSIELQSEPLEYLQSTKKKLWTTIVSLREKLKRKDKKFKGLQCYNSRLRKEVNELKSLVKDLTTELYGGEVLKSMDDDLAEDNESDE